MVIKLKENILNHSNKNRIGEEYDIEISFMKILILTINLWISIIKKFGF